MRADGPVVIALSGSPGSAHTLEWGAAEAARRSARVRLVRTIDDAWQVTPWSWYPPEWGKDVDPDAAPYIADQEATLRKRLPRLAVESRIIHGQTVPCLHEQSVEAQLLVVGARPRTGRARTGSTGVHVAAHACCPVAVIRPWRTGEPDPDTTPPASPDEVVVVGVDGSPASIAAARVAAREAAMRSLPMTIVHVRPTIADPYGYGPRPPVSTAGGDDPSHRAVATIADALRAENLLLDVRLVLTDDDPADALVRLAHRAALLVVGSRGLGTFQGMLLGSVSSAVIRESSCPVLVVHDDGSAGPMRT
ncbi:universal stress protein [Cellulomonas sp.]|uniref:universal stress protein n=1 Tax=Cellulomonas sp. TaxID=40001 RepID=UPI001B2DF588|nr:universal stress protein [Cellulomonas sp.]MBO9555062.1 universal stress protein [Cellulomonas sp.]